MRVVALADTHMFHDELSVPDGDLLVYAGDLCRAGSLGELAEAVRWLRALPHPLKVLVAGNHDWPFVREPDRAIALLGDEVIYLEDAEVTVGGLRVWGSPWQPEFGDWAFNLPRGPRLAERWALIPPGIDILVTHGPPAGTGDRTSTGGRHGCADLRDRLAVVRPRLHLFGHIHEDGGVWVRDGIAAANVTTWECERGPTVIELEPGGDPPRFVLVPPARRR